MDILQLARSELFLVTLTFLLFWLFSQLHGKGACD